MFSEKKQPRILFIYKQGELTIKMHEKKYFRIKQHRKRNRTSYQVYMLIGVVNNTSAFAFVRTRILDRLISKYGVQK